MIFFLTGRLKWSWTQLVGVIFSKSSADLNGADQLVLRFQDADTLKDVDIHIKLKEID